MAVVASTSALIDKLIASITALDSRDSPRFRALKRRVEDCFKSGAYARTDQFAVAAHLEGLQEKFQVFNKDELADALRLRLTELDQHRHSWHPEILSLLLSLSDRPVQLSRVDRIEPTKPRQDAAALSWSELDASGAAYSDQDIWEDVDYGAGSSEDDLTSVSSDGDQSRTRPQSSVAPEDDYVIPDDIFSSGEDDELLASIKDAQFWRDDNISGVHKREEVACQVITELQMVRETIFMLQGLPTSIFWRLDDTIEVDRRYTVGHLSSDTLFSLLRSLCSIGSRIDVLRRFSRRQQTIPYMQTFHRHVEDCLSKFDAFLSNTQSKYLSQTPSTCVSLLQLCDDIRRESRTLLLLADLISKIQRSQSDSPIRCLEIVYDIVCMTQATGDDTEFMFLAELFFACFETYSRPIHVWMETGQLVHSEEEPFFIHANGDNSDLRNLWQGWYTLSDASNAPKFIRPVARKIFITGKSMVFLRHLNAHEDQEPTRNTYLRFQDVYPQEDSSYLCLPFSTLLEAAFGRIVDHNHALASEKLRHQLDQQCGLWISLQALEYIYLGKDMSLFSPVDSKIFDLIDRGKGAWSDRYLLTELAQTAFSTTPYIDPSRLIVRSSDPQRRSRSVKILRSISFDYILPWPVANIITKGSITRYQRIFTFLMQIRRAKHMIIKQRLQTVGEPKVFTEIERNSHVLSYALRHNMLWFLNTIYSHMTDFVIATTTISFRKSLSKSADVNAMIECHASYISSLEDQLLLSANLNPLHQATIALLDLCIGFADLQFIRARKANPAMSNIQSSNRRQKHHHSSSNPSSEDEDHSSDEEFSSDDDDQSSPETEEEREAHRIAFYDTAYVQRLKSIRDQFNRLTHFLVAGLKGVGRVDGQASWEMLAEKLEWRGRQQAGSVV